MQRGRIAAAPGTAPVYRRVILALVLATFAFQSYLVQVHIHGLAHYDAAIQQQMSFNPPDDGKAPPSPEKCLLCQDYVVAGVYLPPAIVALLPPTVAVSVVRLAAVALVFARTGSHIWASRAPPRA